MDRLTRSSGSSGSVDAYSAHDPQQAAPSGRPAVAAQRWRSVSVSPYLYALIALALFLGTVQAASFAGLWTTSGKVAATGEKIVATGQDPAEIKGWMTIDEVTAAYGVTTDDLYARFAIPTDTPSSSPLKDLEKVTPDFSVEGLREWLMDVGAASE